ncbi:pentapeptide repeat-containing protein [Brevibacillus dissolubilis]|uniref:pentapeptide repeat-containing protein n=1 Tax=Brevibacillus dissolubilis TaxID=1844116 RepID=UPI00111742C2|nr:pentapeptide repeat-containing protein [Brevibacillus dissolubilis]
MEHFETTVVQPLLLEQLLALEAYFQEHKDELAVEFLASIQHICGEIRAMQAAGTKGKIGYITYSMLRIELLSGRPAYLIEAMNEEWLFDRTECQAEYLAEWAFRYLDEFTVRCEQAGKAYMGAVTAPDIEKIKLKEAAKFHQYVVALAQYALGRMNDDVHARHALAQGDGNSQAEHANTSHPGAASPIPKHPWLFNQIELEDELEIRVGEYWDISEVVYKRDLCPKDSADTKQWLEEKEEDAYAYECFTGLDLSDGDYGEIDLRYTDFTGSDLSESNLHKAVLVGAKCRECRAAGADFSASLIHEADFSHSDLTGASFAYALGEGGMADPQEWEAPGFFPVNLSEAKLDDALFANASLRGAVFSKASLRGSSFADADGRGAIFTEANLELAKCWGADLEGADFGGANLEMVNFAEANLQGVNFVGAKLAGVYWQGANLTQAAFAEEVRAMIEPALDEEQRQHVRWISPSGNQTVGRSR